MTGLRFRQAGFFISEGMVSTRVVIDGVIEGSGDSVLTKLSRNYYFKRSGVVTVPAGEWNKDVWLDKAVQEGFLGQFNLEWTEENRDKLIAQYETWIKSVGWRRDLVKEYQECVMALRQSSDGDLNNNIWNFRNALVAVFPELFEGMAK